MPSFSVEVIENRIWKFSVEADDEVEAEAVARKAVEMDETCGRVEHGLDVFVLEREHARKAGGA